MPRLGPGLIVDQVRDLASSTNLVFDAVSDPALDVPSESIDLHARLWK